MKKNVFLLIFCLITFGLAAQTVQSLVPGITVDSVMQTHQGATKIDFDRVSGKLHYCTVNGNIYEVNAPVGGAASDVLRYSAADHGITYLQGLYFRDSVLYLCGNVWSATTGIGKVVKGVLQPNGNRVWLDIATTEPYPTANGGGDHGFAGITANPEGTYLFVSSGARTHLGEIRTNGGAWPGLREVPMTCKIFRFPMAATGIVLPNDSTQLEASGYIFARGTRNAFDMAWDSGNNLFAIDNSGERDDPEELNWIRQGRHYGFPWNMGGNDNPLQFSPYDADSDPLVNPQSSGYQNGWFADVPGFPPAPAGVNFESPVRNYGEAADYYRDANTGLVKKASEEGSYVTSFTSHRSPLGLVFDKDSLLAHPYRGNAFVLSFMPGGDSSGYSPISPWGGPCPFVDPSRELVQLNLSYSGGGMDNYTMLTSNVVTGFYLPVDAVLVENVLYVIENGGDIWRLTFPAYTGMEEAQESLDFQVFPNPVNQQMTVRINPQYLNDCALFLYSAQGHCVRHLSNLQSGVITLDREGLPAGMYFLQLRTSRSLSATQKVWMD